MVVLSHKPREALEYIAPDPIGRSHALDNTVEHSSLVELLSHIGYPMTTSGVSVCRIGPKVGLLSPSHSRLSRCRVTCQGQWNTQDKAKTQSYSLLALEQ